mmetsp:Transcript_10129/g.30346  ORF Transcript_10129/g.30346 Transcript_10129/m.30346 type:complete len:289 (+) Transcript_10129:149-1015(+)
MHLWIAPLLVAGKAVGRREARRDVEGARVCGRKQEVRALGEGRTAEGQHSTGGGVGVVRVAGAGERGGLRKAGDGCLPSEDLDLANVHKACARDGELLADGPWGPCRKVLKAHDRPRRRDAGRRQRVKVARAKDQGGALRRHAARDGQDAARGAFVVVLVTVADEGGDVRGAGRNDLRAVVQLASAELNLAATLQLGARDVHRAARTHEPHVVQSVIADEGQGGGEAHQGQGQDCLLLIVQDKCRTPRDLSTGGDEHPARGRWHWTAVGSQAGLHVACKGCSLRELCD